MLKGLLSTTASRAWMGVVVVGIVVVALVLGLQLIPRLSAGQTVIDAAKPALGAEAVKGEVGGTDVLSQFVDMADPLMTRRGKSNDELRTLVTMIKRKTGVSAERARALLRREAPHTEALLRAVPFSGVADERRKLTAYLSVRLNVAPEDVQDELARSFPHIYQMLANLPNVTSGWYDVPGIEGLARFKGKPVRSMPGVRKYLRKDLVGTIVEQQNHFQALAGSGGIGYIPWLLLVLGAGLALFGFVHARWSAGHPSGRVAWGAVVAAGVLVLVLVGALQYFPRFTGAATLVAKIQPAFNQQRVLGLRAGTDLTVQAVHFGDPMMTPSGGGADEVPKLVAFVADRSGLAKRDVRSQLKKAAPRTMALFDAIPLSAVATEVPHLLAILSRKLHVGGDSLVKSLRKRTPGLAQALLAVGPATAGWDTIPGSDGLKRFELGTPVRSMPQFADYLDLDAVPLFETQQGNFAKLADTWPPLKVFPGLILGIGALLAIYATAMLFLATGAPRRY